MKSTQNVLVALLFLLLMMTAGSLSTEAMAIEPAATTLLSRESGEENIMIVHDVEAQPGDIITIEIEIVNDSEFVGFNLQLLLPEGFTYVENSTQLYRKADHQYGFAVNEDENTALIIAFSLTNSPFSGNEGVIFSLDVQTPAEPGEYLLAITDAVIGNAQMQDVLTGTQNGMVTLSGAETFALTLLADPQDGGVLSGAGDYHPGDVVSIDAAANSGYSFLQWSDAGGDAISDEPAFLFTMPDHDAVLVAEFAINTYIITATAGANGNISPSGAVMVEHGDNRLFMIMPDEGYFIADVVVNGASVGVVPAYIFMDVISNHTIHAEFATEEDPGDILHIAQDEDVVVDESVCFFSGSSMLVAGEGYVFTVKEGGEATLAATNAIRLLPGVTVNNGGSMLVYITGDDPCGRPFAGEKLPVKDESTASIAGTGEDDNSFYFTLYPNPTDSEITIIMSRFSRELPVRIEVFNMMGTMILSKELPAREFYSLGLFDLQAGMYFIRVIQGDNLAVKRLIKR